jgi:hypothetical protein
MMKIYSVEEAQETILERKTLNRNAYSPVTIEATERGYGETFWVRRAPPSGS